MKTDQRQKLGWYYIKFVRVELRGSITILKRKTFGWDIKARYLDWYQSVKLRILTKKKKPHTHKTNPCETNYIYIMFSLSDLTCILSKRARDSL